jgi:hypothetical protein
MDNLQQYLQPGKYTDSNHSDIIDFAKNVIGKETNHIEQAQATQYNLRQNIVFLIINGLELLRRYFGLSHHIIGDILWLAEEKSKRIFDTLTQLYWQHQLSEYRCAHYFICPIFLSQRLSSCLSIFLPTQLPVMDFL